MIFRKSFEKIQVPLKSDNNNRYFTWRPIYIFDHISLSRMRNVSDKSCRENENTHFVFGNFFFFENGAVCEIMWKNFVEPNGPQMTIWRMCIACWIPKATNTHSEYVILITFPLQQWLRERVSMLLYTYIACLVSTLVLILPPLVGRHYTFTAVFCLSSLVLWKDHLSIMSTAFRNRETGYVSLYSDKTIGCTLRGWIPGGSSGF